jgi:hypothetical protein
MPGPAVALVAGGTALLGGAMQSRAAGKAADAQSRSAQMGIDAQERAYNEMRMLLEPYTEAGPEALQAMRAQLGLEGAAPQQAAIQQIADSPLLQQLTQQGEQAMLQNASATGGLRGGNIQGALAQFRPAMLQAALDQQYARLGGLATAGQNSAAGVGTAGMQTGANTANLLGRMGQAQAGGIIGKAAPYVQMLQMPAQMAGFGFGRGGSTPAPGANAMFGGTAPNAYNEGSYGDFSSGGAF